MDLPELSDDIPLAKLSNYRWENGGWQCQGNKEAESEACEDEDPEPEECEDEDHPGEALPSDEASSTSSSTSEPSESSSSESSHGTLPPKGGLAEPPNLPKLMAEPKRKRGKRSNYVHDPRCGRWGSFYFSYIEGPNWGGFSVQCPLHKGNGHLCTRQRSWHKPDSGLCKDAKTARLEQKQTILGLMQWCACVGNNEIKDEEMGPRGKAAHKNYCYKKEDMQHRLRTSARSVRLSHGLSDDEHYNPLHVLGLTESDSD